MYPSLLAIQAEEARRSLLEFVKQAWHVLEPDADFVDGWHIHAICEHLEAVSQGQISKLIINVPPGHMKSLLCCVFWPTWEWISRPYLRWLFATYSSDLTIRDSIKTRQLISSDWYQARYGHLYQLVKTNERKITNDKLGFRIATSIGGMGTGERVHRVVNDDLLRANDAGSEAMQEEAIRHMKAMSTRGVGNDHFGQVLIMQRLDGRDPTAWAMEQGNWEKLILPAEFESKRRASTCIGFVDPRQEDGELLWPTLFPRERIEELKVSLGPYDAAAQLQQIPTPADGGIVKLEWFADKYYSALPPVEFLVQSWDTAFKTGQKNDYSVCTTWAACKNGYYLVDRYKQRIEFPELKNMMIALSNQYKPAVILVEDKASGQSVIQELKRNTRLPLKPIKVDVDKERRLKTASPTLQYNVYLPANAPWLRDYLETLIRFPMGTHDDDVDSTSQAINYLVLQRPVKMHVTSVNVMGR